LPRPVNPYVKLRLGGREGRTNVLTNTKNPVWAGTREGLLRGVGVGGRGGGGGEGVGGGGNVFRFPAEDPNALLKVTVGDWKLGKNVWIARLAIPLASIEVCPPTSALQPSFKRPGRGGGQGGGEDVMEGGVTKEFQLRLRVSRFGTRIEKEGVSEAKLTLKLKYEFWERSWTLDELKARDEERLRQEEEEEEEEEERGRSGGVAVAGGWRREGGKGGRGSGREGASAAAVASAACVIA